MGGQICSAEQTTHEDDPLSLIYDHDPKENNIVH